MNYIALMIIGLTRYRIHSQGDRLVHCACLASLLLRRGIFLHIRIRDLYITTLDEKKGYRAEFRPI